MNWFLQCLLYFAILSCFIDNQFCNGVLTYGDWAITSSNSNKQSVGAAIVYEITATEDSALSMELRLYLSDGTNDVEKYSMDVSASGKDFLDSAAGVTRFNVVVSRNPTTTLTNVKFTITLSSLTSADTSKYLVVKDSTGAVESGNSKPLSVSNCASSDFSGTTVTSSVLSTDSSTLCTVGTYNCVSTFACSSDYKQVSGGTLTRTCQSDATWDSTAAICEKITCSASSINCAECEVKGDNVVASYNYSDVVSVGCKTGFDPVDTRINCNCTEVDSWNCVGSLTCVEQKVTTTTPTATETSSNDENWGDEKARSTTTSTTPPTTSTTTSTSTVSSSTVATTSTTTTRQSTESSTTVKSSAGRTKIVPEDQIQTTTTTKLGRTSKINTEKGGLSPGAIAGIVIGVVVVLGIIVVIVLMLKKKKKQSESDGSDVPMNSNKPAPSSV